MRKPLLCVLFSLSLSLARGGLALSSSHCVASSRPQFCRLAAKAKKKAAATRLVPIGKLRSSAKVVCDFAPAVAVVCNSYSIAIKEVRTVVVVRA